MTPTQELFRDKSYCYDEIRRIREVFGDKRTTRRQYDALMATVAFMLLNCDDSIYYLVLGLLEEATRRQLYFEFNYWIPEQIRIKNETN